MSGIFNSHTIARLILFFLVSLTVTKIHKKKCILNNKLKLLLLFYFFTQGISILNSINVIEFLRIFKNVAVGILFFYEAVYVLDSQEKIHKFLKLFVISILINLTYLLIVYFQPDSAIPLLNYFSYGDYWKVFMTNFSRQRYFIDIFDFAFIPLIIFFISLKKQEYPKPLLYLIIFLLVFFSFLSNFRTHIFMIAVSLSLMVIIIKKELRKFQPLKNTLVLLVFSFFTVLYLFKSSTLIRIIFPQIEESETVETRLNFWKISIEMGFEYPFTGIGLGNFFEYLPSQDKYAATSNRIAQDLIDISYTNPHSILFGTLAESGFLGLLSFILLFGYFLIKDLQIKKNFYSPDLYVTISFWSLFSYSLLSPYNSLLYLNLLWVLRAIIERMKVTENF